MAVTTGQRDDLRRDGLGETMLEVRRVGVQHLGHARDLARRLGGFAGIVAGDENVHVGAAGGGGGDGIERGALDRLVVVFGNDECGHVRLPVRSLWLRS